MYFEDLTPYGYCFREPPFLDDVLNIGWLDLSHAYTKGKSDPGFLSKLWAVIAQTNPIVDVHVNRMRSVRPCDLCGGTVRYYFGKPDLLGMSEIWIPAGNLWYAAPSMVVHYVETHEYLPPERFVIAVQKMSVSEPYNAQDAYDRRMRIRFQPDAGRAARP